MAKPDQHEDDNLHRIDAVHGANISTDHNYRSDLAGPDEALNEDMILMDTPLPYRDRITQITGISAVILAIAWTCLFIWSQLPVIAEPGFIFQIPQMIVNWCVPILLIALGYWMISRRRKSDAIYFQEQSGLVEHAGEQLLQRLQHMNGELAIAREFIANQSTQLESLGRRAVSDLTSHAERVSDLVGDSRTNMEVVARVSSTAEENMTKLREQMPVVISTSKDMANQIGTAGLTAQKQIKGMVDGFNKINTFGQASDQQVIDLEARVDAALTALQTKATEIDTISKKSGEFLLKSSDSASAMLTEKQVTTENQLSGLLTRLEEGLARTSEEFEEQTQQYEQLIARMNENHASQLHQISSRFEGFEERMHELDLELDGHEEGTVDKIAKISFALSSVRNELDNIGESLDAFGTTTQDLHEQSGSLRAGYAGLADEIEDNISGKVGTLVHTLEQNAETTGAAAANVEKIKVGMQLIDELTSNNLLVLSEQEQHISNYSEQFSKFTSQHADYIQEAGDALDALEKKLTTHLDIIEKSGDERVLAKFGEIELSSQTLLSQVQTNLQDIVDEVSLLMSKRTENALEASVRAKSDEVIGKLQTAVNHALGATHQASASLTDQLSKVDELANNLQQRVNHIQETSESNVNQDLSRNLALLTESLNSTSIDVAKILSNDVTDTAWAAYLKGDRGVFTRRAARLVSNSDAREIAQHYETEPEFKDTVNRYIHDFEAILRDLLSTRNGDAISVTLLSSDMGKLYVALAQSIERFR